MVKIYCRLSIYWGLQINSREINLLEIVDIREIEDLLEIVDLLKIVDLLEIVDQLETVDLLDLMNKPRGCHLQGLEVPGVLAVRVLLGVGLDGGLQYAQHGGGVILKINIKC